MPGLRDISVKIHTPFAIQGIPEVALPIDHPATSLDGQGGDEINTSSAVIIPALSQSIFWISYATKQPTEDDDTFFVFKLFDGQEPLITWSCGKEQEWNGKMQFALFDGDKVRGSGGMQKRVLQFGEIKPSAIKDPKDDQCVAVKVYRANVKTRIARQLEAYADTDFAERDIQFLQAGQTKRGQPRKFYKFRLVDPLDEPYATFRFFYRTFAEVEAIDPSIAKIYTEQPPRRFLSNDLKPKLPPRPLTAQRSPKRRQSRLFHSALRASIQKAPNLPPMPHLPAEVETVTLRDSGDISQQRLAISPSAPNRDLFEDKPLPPTPTKCLFEESESGPVAPLGAARGGGRKFRALLQSALSNK